MIEKEIIDLIEATLTQKMEYNSIFIRYSFYELRVKYNLSEKEEAVFLSLIRNKLNNMRYTVYFRGEEYQYNNKKILVEDNELLVAIKDKGSAKWKKN